MKRLTIFICVLFLLGALLPAARAEEPEASTGRLMVVWTSADPDVADRTGMTALYGAVDMVFFTSDNGGEGYRHARLTNFFKGNGPLRGYKFTVYEGGIRETFIARWPGKIKGGTKSDHVSAFWDFLP